MVVLSQGHTLTEALLPPSVLGATPNSPDSAIASPAPSVSPRIDDAIERWAEEQDGDLIGRIGRLGERVLISWAINRERGVKLRAANRLGINRVTLDRKLAEYDIHVKRGIGVIDPSPIDA